MKLVGPSIAAAVAAFVGLAGGVAQAAPDPYKNCSSFNAKYPVGVARSVPAANAAAITRHERPVVNKRVYSAALKANYRLGGPTDGVICEVPLRFTAPGPVQALSVAPGSDPQTTKVLTWLPPVSDGGSPVTYYELSDQRQTWRQPVGASGAPVSSTVTGLTPGIYLFTVRAVNAAGWSIGTNVATEIFSAPTPTATGSAAARYYATCADARAAGVTPIRRGTATYDVNTHLDRDGDGIACE